MSRNPTHKRGAQEPQDRDSKSVHRFADPRAFWAMAKPESGC